MVPAISEDFDDEAPIGSRKAEYNGHVWTREAVDPIVPALEAICNSATPSATSRSLLDRNIIQLYPPEPKTSDNFVTPGPKYPHCVIAGINGIRTSFIQAISHAEYLGSFANQSVNWTYNKTHGTIIDAVEAIFLNYTGYSPNTSNALLNQWTQFHEANKGFPRAKLLQFCHSQGAIDVRNTLANALHEIRERVIVVAIAPAAVVPDELCFKSFNYASKNDPIHFVELALAGGFDTNEFGISKAHEMILENHNELILLDPHSDASDIDHDFQSPTFKPIIEKHINDYLEIYRDLK